MLFKNIFKSESSKFLLMMKERNKMEKYNIKLKLTLMES